MKRPGVTGLKKMPSHLRWMVRVASSRDSQPAAPSSARRGARSSPQASALAFSTLFSFALVAAWDAGPPADG